MSKIAPLELPEGEEDGREGKGSGRAENSDRVDTKTLNSGSDRNGNGNRRLRPVKLEGGSGKEAKVTRDTTFLHLDTRVPDELKYGLHQLMIRREYLLHFASKSPSQTELKYHMDIFRC